MIFNEYVWSLYAESREGKIKIESYRSMDSAKGAEFSLKSHPHLVQTISDYFDDVYEINLVVESESAIELSKYIDDFVLVLRENLVNDDKSAASLYNKVVEYGMPFFLEDKEGEQEIFYFSCQEDVGFMCEHIDLFSVSLYLAHPEYFLPYFFFRDFVALEMIAKHFNISLPRLPGRRKAEEKVMFYWELNEILREFRLVQWYESS